MYTGLHVKYPLFLTHFKETWLFSTDSLKIHTHKFSWKSVQWEPRCPCWQTDGHDKANSRFRNFVNAPENWRGRLGVSFSQRCCWKFESSGVWRRVAEWHPRRPAAVVWEGYCAQAYVNLQSVNGSSYNDMTMYYQQQQQEWWWWWLL